MIYIYIYIYAFLAVEIFYGHLTQTMSNFHLNKRVLTFSLQLIDWNLKTRVSLDLLLSILSLLLIVRISVAHSLPTRWNSAHSVISLLSFILNHCSRLGQISIAQPSFLYIKCIVDLWESYSRFVAFLFCSHTTL